MAALTLEAVTQAMLAKIQGSLLDESDAKKLKFEPLTAAQVVQYGVPAKAEGFLIPYFDFEGVPTDFWRLRYLKDTRKGFEALTGKKALRYVQRTGGTNEVYLPPFVDWQKLAENTAIPLVITEGELKAACATKVGIPTIGLGGVYCFKSVKQREALLPMLRQIEWAGRKVIICYDSDAVTNPNVVIAENQLAKELAALGAEVHIARLVQEDDNKIGIDDFLLTHEPTELKDILDKAEPYRTSAALHAMNEKVVYIRNPGLIYAYCHDMKLSHSSFTQHAYANVWHEEIQVTSNGEKFIKKQTATAWLQWPARSELDAITFAPGQPKVVGRKLNTWSNWAVEPKEGSVAPWELLLDHLFQHTEPEARTWFEQWCAYPLQHPGYKMANAAVFWGNVQGSGKTMVGHTLMKIYGKHSAEITDAELEDDRFDWAENMQFVLADDITGSHNRKLANRLKTMITQKYLKINPKYVPRYSVPDCINYYFTSNDPDAFFLDDGDRRYFIHEVVAARIDHVFRDAYTKWRDSEDGMPALFHHLLNLDLTGFDPQSEPFRTRAKNEMTSLTKSDISHWVAEMKVSPEKTLKLKGDLYTAAELLSLYDPNSSTRVTVNGVARELKKAGFRSPTNSPVTMTKFGGVRLYVVRNFENWAGKVIVKDVVEHYESSREMEPSKKVKF
jgi:Domain of unknown function (DUF3854)/Family of unknown function (DUF5906)